MSASTTATKKTAPTAKKITIQGTSGTRHAEYNPISDSYLRANPKAVLTALIHGMNAHCADMLITMLDIMADKYGHSTNDLIDAVKGDDRWKAVTEHPVLNSLGYFDQEDADRVIGKKSAAATTAEDLHDSVKPAKVAKPTAEEEAPAPAPVKKSSKKKAATEPVEEVKETITHAEAYGYGSADITPGHVAVVEEAPAPVPAKKTTKKKAPAEETPVAEEAPVLAKKTTKKKAPAEEAAVPAEEEPAPAKKQTKKKAATADEAVDAITESVAKLTTEEAAPAPAKKKVVSKKPVAAKPA